MPHISVLAQRYAEGLLRVVRDTKNFLEVAEELEDFTGLLDKDPRVRDLMENPAYSSDDRLALLERIRSQLRLSDPSYGLLRLVIQKKRTHLIGEIVEAYGELYRQELGIQRAQVIVAHEISPEMRDRVAQVVQSITGKKPELEINVEPGLIGGIKVRMGNTILDATVKTKLEELRENLLTRGGTPA